MKPVNHAPDYVAPAGSLVLEIASEAGGYVGPIERKQVFRSSTRLRKAAEAERAAGNHVTAYRVIGSGPDGYTEQVSL